MLAYSHLHPQHLPHSEVSSSQAIVGEQPSEADGGSLYQALTNISGVPIYSVTHTSSSILGQLRNQALSSDGARIC